jgi:hypothetical protein
MATLGKLQDKELMAKGKKSQLADPRKFGNNLGVRKVS